MSHACGGSDAGADGYLAAVAETHAAFPALVVSVHDQMAEGGVEHWEEFNLLGLFAGQDAAGVNPMSEVGPVARGRGDGDV